MERNSFNSTLTPIRSISFKRFRPSPTSSRVRDEPFIVDEFNYDIDVIYFSMEHVLNQNTVD